MYLKQNLNDKLLSDITLCIANKDNVAMVPNGVSRYRELEDLKILVITVVYHSICI